MEVEKFFYKTPCNDLAKKYFSTGYRTGIIYKIKHASRSMYAEEALLEGITTTTNNKIFLMSRAYLYNFLINLKYSSFTNIQQSGLILDTSIDSCVRSALLYSEKKYKYLKIKISNNIDYEIEKIKEINANIGNKISLRLDCNKQLNYLEAFKLIKALENCNIQYIEEPLINIYEIKNLYEKTYMNFAIDESFFNEEDLLLMQYLNIKYLIIKQGRFLNIFLLVKIVKKAIKIGVVPIFSTCFESEFTASLMCLLISYLNLNNHTHGLYVENLFEPVFSSPKLQASINILECCNFLKNFEMN